MHLPDACPECSFLIFSPSRTALPRRDWPLPSFPHPDWFPGARRPAGTKHKGKQIDQAPCGNHKYFLN